MYSEWQFWLPCLVTIAVVLLSLLLFGKLFMKWGNGSPTTTVSAGSASSTSASASLPGGEYEVFLSFNGKDTRKGFTDFLYTYLVDAGIRTFRDNNELRVGEEIGPELVKAINESKISIPIFSKNYASSKWCLYELAQMVECQTNMGRMIFPIFYDIEPSDVRNQRGSYEKAFHQHKNLDKETVQGWKEALKKVGQLKGLELKKETDGHEGDLVKKVVEKVLLALKKNYTILPDNLVGIDHHIEAIKGFLNADSNDDVRVVGIYGMGGLGKTTIAKVVYNQLFERFESCCFLEDVRETSQLKGLTDLQSQLISKILKRKFPNIFDVDEGVNVIKDTVCRKSVLLVLDDVDDKYQFDKLAGKCDWFRRGSRIIVTTRNKEVLDQLEANMSYEPPVMESDDALQLFSKYAFMRDSPLEDFDMLSKKAISTAAGLPLALVTIGSLLFGKGKDEWEEKLTKLEKIPAKKILEKLRISFEALDHGQKQIFLDIACLFIGKDKTYPFYMWKDCEFYPTDGINVLVRMSLVKVGDDNILRMHDQLRDLGRHIVCEENLNEVGERSRLWLPDETWDIMERRMGTTKIEALRLDLPLESHRYCFTKEEFGKLPNLRFLQVDYADLAGDFGHLLSKLRWLQWRRCPGNYTPSNFHLKNLVILDLKGSKITDEAWSQIKIGKKLKVLDLSRCSLLKQIDFSTFATLERLFLCGCDLEQLDPSIGNLISLRLLDIEGCMITKLPDAVGNLEKLEELIASGCRKLAEIPCNFGRLSSLRILKLVDTRISSLPRSISGLSHLQILHLIYCNQLESLPELPPSLTSLQVSSDSMETLPSLSDMIHLKELCFLQCPNLMEIPGDIGKLSKLETLSFEETKIRSLPAEISALSRLERLEVKHCNNLRCIMGLPSSLSKLILEGCSELMEIQGLGKLKLLASMRVIFCGKLKLDGLDRLQSLSYLAINSSCQSLDRLPDLSNLKKLRRLMTRYLEKLIEIQGLDRLESLEHLDMIGCISMERLPHLPNTGMLKEVYLQGCQKLAVVEGLGDLESLEVLYLEGCISMERLPDLSNLGRLKELDVSRCISLERSLDLSNLQKLKELRIRGWKTLTEIRGLEELKSLQVLDTAECKLIEKTPDLSNLKNLRRLSVANCEKLTKIQGLEELKSLQSLNTVGCKSIENLRGLEELKTLEFLSISGDMSNENLPHLPNTRIDRYFNGRCEAAI